MRRGSSRDKEGVEKKTKKKKNYVLYRPKSVFQNGVQHWLFKIKYKYGGACVESFW